MLGACALAACLILCVLSVRPRLAAVAAFPLRFHEVLGWLALGTAALHVGLLLGVDRHVLEHLKPSAPRYEIAGIAALLLLVFLVVPAGATLRSRLWARHRTFQASHVIAAALLVVTVAMHVVATDRYVHGRAGRVIYALLSCIALLGLLRARAVRPPAPQPSVMHGLVFGRHSRLVLGVVLVSLVALLALVRAGTTLHLREPLLRRTDRLALDFPHDRHRAVNCILCHHNFTDRTGVDSCVSCHRSGRADLRFGAEARFHDFCLGCHRYPPAYLSAHGPVTGCDSCHAPH